MQPLSFHSHLQSPLWKEQIESLRIKQAHELRLAAKQIQDVVGDHASSGVPNISEADLLRTAGAFRILGLELGPYLLAGYDCQQSVFQFQQFPRYLCPVEVKKRSKGFAYQIQKYKELPRAVVLCITHDLENLPEDIDVIELMSLAGYLATITG